MKIFDLELYAKADEEIFGKHFLDEDYITPLVNAKTAIKKTLDDIVDASGSSVYDIDVAPVYNFFDDGKEKIIKLVGIEAHLKIAGDAKELDIPLYMTNLYKLLLEYNVTLDLEGLQEQGYSIEKVVGSG